jgi:hypothetical protein
MLIEEKKGKRILIACSDSEMRLWQSVVARGDLSKLFRQLMNAFVAQTLNKRKTRK